MRLASVTLLLASACTTPGTQFYGGDDTPIDNGGGPGGSGGCTRITSVTPIAPLIQLVVDGSGTMNDNNKYSAMQSALYDATNGLLVKLQSKAQFGATAYTYTGGGNCPSSVKSSPCSLNNMAGVKTAIDGQKNQNGTDPLKEALDQLHTSYGALTDKDRNLVIITDGAANGCGGGGNANDAITSLTTLNNDGVTSYLIGYGNLGNWGTSMAAAGTGSATAYNATTATVQSIYSGIFDQIIDCKLSTDQTIDINGASSDTLSMDGTSLAYTTDWKILDDHTIQLVGTACTNYKATTTAPTFTASICGT